MAMIAIMAFFLCATAMLDVEPDLLEFVAPGSSLRSKSDLVDAYTGL